MLKEEQNQALTGGRRRISENIKRDKATEEDKNINNKLYYMDRLGYDTIDETNVDIIKSYYKKDHIIDAYLAHISPDLLDKRKIANLSEIDNLANI